MSNPESPLQMILPSRPEVRLKVAGIQALSRVGKPQENLDRAAHLVSRAASQGAQLVVCPEMLASGHLLDPAICEGAEPRGGLTESWLCELSANYGIHLGAGYLERDGLDTYNTFSLADPSGNIAGRVRKSSFGYFESWVFRRGELAPIIETALGRLGVGICFDNYTRRFVDQIALENVDLLLMPHSTPALPKLPALSRSIRESLTGIAPYVSRCLGIPSILVNKAGPSPFQSRLPISPVGRVWMDFEGLSRIVDAGGRLLACLEGGEAIVQAEVTLRKRSPAHLPRSEFHPFWSLAPRRFPALLCLLHWALTGWGEAVYGRRRRR